MTETSFIDQMMGFDPSSLEVFHEVENTNNYEVNVYKTNPVKFSKADDGHYRSKIRIIYNPFNVKRSIVQQATYAMTDADGFFMVKSKLGNGDKECPLFKSWKRLWFSGDDAKKEWARKMYDKTESQWVLVQILEDVNQPELVGQIKVMKLPKAIFAKLDAKMNPSPESKKTPIPIMDYLFGLPLEMDVVPGPDDPQHPERKQREISYDLCDFDTDYAPIVKTDGSALFTEAEIETIDNFVTARDEFSKGKTAAKKEAAKKTMADLTPAIKELYKKSLDYLKANAINLEDECTYKEWDEATAARVQRWIDVVAQMRDPKTYVGEARIEELKQQAAAVTAPDVNETSAMPDTFAEVAGGNPDDLPF